MDSESSDMDSDDEYNANIEAEAMYDAETARLKAAADAAAQDVAGTSTNRKRSRDCGDSQQGILQAHVPEVFNLADVVADPGVRRQIDDYATPQIRSEMRREYLSRGPTRLFGHDFPRGENRRNFKEAWFREFDWLEYSIQKDAAYCFYCFLFKPQNFGGKFGGDAFTKTGYKNWKKAKELFNCHVGGPSSAHNNARKCCEDFKNQKQSVSYAIIRQDEKAHIDYEKRLRAVVGVARFLLSQGLAFRGHDESDTSLNKGNFRELLDWYAERCQDVADVLDRNIVEINHRFSETSTRLLQCTACLDPRDSFSSFDHEKLMELARLYSVDFSSHDLYILVDQLNIYIDVMKRSPDFLTCHSLSVLALKLVQTRQHLAFPLVYRLIKLALTLPVATASVERVFSAMNIIKTDLRNKIGDDWLNDLMICFVEREIFAKISDKQVMLRFHALKDRRGHLPRQFCAPSTNTT